MSPELLKQIEARDELCKEGGDKSMFPDVVQAVYLAVPDRHKLLDYCRELEARQTDYSQTVSALADKATRLIERDTLRAERDELARCLDGGVDCASERIALRQQLAEAKAENARLMKKYQAVVVQENEHCKDCCCARSWKALGIDTYTGKSIPEHITDLRAELAEWQRMRNESMDLAHKLSDAFSGTQAELAEAKHQFQNFHRLLCERFGYGHDPVDWQRDQLSLIEWIAAKLTAYREASEAMRAALDGVRAKLAEYLERLLQGRALPNRWVGEINDIVGAALALNPSDAKEGT